jgi:hypothetical protein
MSDFWVCHACFGLYGQSGNRRQLCSCSSPEEHRALADARYQIAGTYWTRLAAICFCCGAQLLNADHKFALWFCGGCLDRAREVNEACGRCAIPIGWHSIVNGVFIPGNRCKTLIGATGAADELGAFFRESADIHEWSKQVIERHWRSAGLPLDQDVPVDDYLSAVIAMDPVTSTLFDELVEARGIPPHWHELEAIPLELVWEEETEDGRSFQAYEEIVWRYPDGEDEFADLTLRVASAGDGWVWEVLLDEEVAGEGDPLLAHGVASTVDDAKRECDAMALHLIAQEEERSALREVEEREARLSPTWAEGE